MVNCTSRITYSRKCAALALATLFVCLLASPALADTTTITLDTSGLTGTAAQLALDFVGGPSPSNTVTITDFLTDGSLGTQTPTGDATGTLPGSVTLDDANFFFNELLANMTLGSFLSFQIDTTNLGPSAGSFPDEFSLFLYDASFNSLIATSDPTGANAIATIDLTGAATTTDTLYTSDATFGSSGPVATPEPTSLLLLASIAGAVLIVQRRRAGRLLFRGRSAARSAAVAAALLGSLSAQTDITTPVAADNSVTVSLSGMRLNRSTNTYDSVVTVTNTSAAPIIGPFYLAVSGIDVPTVTFYNAAGLLPNKLPYIPLSGTQLLPNTPVVGGTLKFSDPQNVAFHVNTGVWDSASLPQFGVSSTTMSCPGLPEITSGPGIAGYSLPIDSVGRTATCVPSPSAWLPLGDNWVQCSTSGGSAPPAACAFDEVKLPFQEVCLINCGTSSGPAPGTADVSLRPCATLTLTGAGPSAGVGLPPGLIPIPVPIQSVPTCDFDAPGTASFSLVNNGPYTAYKVDLALGVPLQYTSYSMQFDHPAYCTIAASTFVQTPQGALEQGTYMPDGSFYTNGIVLNCFFPSIPSGQIINANVGVDLPSYSGSSLVASLYAQVAVDSTQNTDPDLTNNSIAFFPLLLTDSVFSPPAPVSPACSRDPNDRSFDTLLDTCGIPSTVVQPVSGVYLGGATALGGSGAIKLDDFPSLLGYLFYVTVEGGGIQ